MGRKLFVGLVAPLLAVAIAVPAKADAAQDRQFIATLEDAGWTISNPRAVISLGNMVCNEGLQHGVTWQEMRSTLVSSYGASRSDATTLISKAVSVYCPKYAGAISDMGSDSGSAGNNNGSGDQGDLFVQSLKRNGISIDKSAAVDMAKAACKAPLAGIGLANAWQAMQQSHPEYDLNTVARVMSQGILAYCPGRLG